MKILDKIGLVLFSSIILLVSLALILTIAGWLDLDLVIDSVEYITTDNIGAKVTFGISLVLILLAIKCIFLNSGTKSTSNSKDGILLENDSGKLTASLQKNIKETITKSLDLEVKDVNVRIKNITVKKEVKE